MTIHQSRIISKLCVSSIMVFTLQNTAAMTIKADIYADNWFALYQENKLIKEDSVPFNTERSFNTESFTFNAELPAQFSVIIKDYYENDTGLEYIGSRRQQMGDGGFVAQFFNADTDQLIEVSDNNWRCTVIHQAPLNKSCSIDDEPEKTCTSNISEPPQDWQAKDFDDSSWPTAIEYSFNAVRPHGGYRDASWRDEAKLIWSNDLEVDNVLLCRFTIDSIK